MHRLFTYTLNFVYLLLAMIVAPLIAWTAWRKGKYREGWGCKLLGNVPRRSLGRRCAWFHAVSVGEINLLQTLIPRFKSRYPDWDIAISTTTQTGYALACEKYPQTLIFYCPLDFSWAVQRALTRLQPNLLVLAELELWPNLIRLSKQRGVDVAIVNGRLSENSYRGYRKIRWALTSVLRSLDLVAVQDPSYEERFANLGVARSSIKVTGSLKFDGAETDRANARTTALRPWVDGSEQVFLAGSTQAPEEQMAIEIFEDLKDAYPHMRLVLVPRHPERFDEVAQLLDEKQLPYVRRSETKSAEAPHEVPRIVLVDVIGELGAWWGLTSIGFVGGSFGTRGGQNMIEPTAYGVATCFGPKTVNFRDVVSLLLDADASKVVNNQTEMHAFVGRCLRDEGYRSALGERAQKTVSQHKGAADATIDLLTTLPCLQSAENTSNRAA